MIRSKKLLTDYQENPNRKIELGEKPKKEDLLPPLDTILCGLYDINDKLPSIHKRLQSRNLSIDQLVEINTLLRPGEIAVEELEKSVFRSVDYNMVAAKVIIAGDRLDKIITGQINALAADFEKKYEDLLNWKPSYGMDSVNKTRSELKANLLKFFGKNQLKFLYESRSLPSSEIATVISIFEDYVFKLGEIKKIDTEIARIGENYEAINSKEHLADFLKDLKIRTKRGILSTSGDLRHACQTIDYKEGLAELINLRDEAKYVLRKHKKFLKVKASVKQAISNLKKYSTILSTESLTDSTLNVVSLAYNIKQDSYSDFSKITFFSKLVNEYKSLAMETKKQATELIQTEYKRLGELDEDPSKLLILYQRIAPFIDVKDKMKELESKITTYLPKIDPNIEATGDYFKLVEAIEGTRISGGWDKRLEYVQWFVQNKTATRTYLVNGTDFAIAQDAYNKLNAEFTTGRIGAPNCPCLKERLNITSTLGILHDYIETSRAVNPTAVPA